MGSQIVQLVTIIRSNKLDSISGERDRLWCHIDIDTVERCHVLSHQSYRCRDAPECERDASTARAWILQRGWDFDER
jgi:hypothetical protein